MIIENAEDVYQFLGLDESYIADAKNWSVNVEWNTETGDITFYRSDGSGRVTLKIGV